MVTTTSNGYISKTRFSLRLLLWGAIRLKIGQVGVQMGAKILSVQIFKISPIFKMAAILTKKASKIHNFFR